MVVYDVIIVGGGISGLCSARMLKQRGLKVVVLEATNRVGGRMMTYYQGPDDAPYAYADVGAAYVAKAEKHIMRLCDELGLKIVENLHHDDKNYHNIVYYKGKGKKEVDLTISLQWPNLIASWEFRRISILMEKMCWEIPPDRPWDAPKAKEWDNISVKEFFDNHCWTSYCHQYCMVMLSIWMGAEANQLSMLYYLWFLRLADGPLSAWGFTGETIDLTIKGGTQQIAERIAKDLEDCVLLNQPVIMIKHNSKDVTVRTLTGSELKAKYLILATPANTQAKIHFEPKLSPIRSCLIQRSPIGVVMKSVVFYDEPFWEEKGLTSTVTCMDDSEIVAAVDILYKEDPKCFGVSCFSYLHQVITLSKLNDTEKLKAICNCLAKFYDSDKALKPVKFVYKLWSEEEYLGGGFCCHYEPGILTSFGPAMRAPIGPRVFLAGTETATHYRSFMDGAIDAGQRAAREVFHAEGLIAANEIFVQEPENRIYKVTTMDELLPTIGTVVKLSWAILFAVVAMTVYMFIE